MGRHFTLKQIPKLLTDWEVFQAKAYAPLPEIGMPLALITPGAQIVDSVDDRRLRDYCRASHVRPIAKPEWAGLPGAWGRIYEGKDTYAFSTSGPKGNQAEIHFPTPDSVEKFVQSCPIDFLPRSMEFAFKRGVVHYDLQGKPTSWHRLVLDKEQSGKYFAEQYHSMKHEYFAPQQTLVHLERVIEDLFKGNAHMIHTKVHFPCPPGRDYEEYARFLGLSTDPQVTPYLIPVLTKDASSVSHDLFPHGASPAIYSGTSNLSCLKLQTFVAMLDRFIKFGQTPPHEIRPQFRQHPRTGKKFRTASKLGRPALILGVPDVIEGSYVRSWVYKDDYIRDLSRRTA